MNKHGYKPTAIRVAIDALAVYVNKDNPVKGMTICGGGCDFFRYA